MDKKALEVDQYLLTNVLERMVAVELARWLDSTMHVLKDEFGFDEQQLTEFAKEFRKRMTDEKETPISETNNS